MRLPVFVTGRPWRFLARVGLVLRGASLCSVLRASLRLFQQAGFSTQTTLPARGLN